MPESTAASGSFVQLRNLFQECPGEGGKDHLRDPLPVSDGVRLAAVIDHYHADFAAIVRVYGAGSVDQGNTVLERQTTAWSDLRLIAIRQSYGNPRRYASPPTGQQ